MAVCKQYTEHEGDAWWYKWVLLYKDGSEVNREKISIIDLDEDIEMIEHRGYVKAYTDEQIAEIEKEIARLQYRKQFMCEHRLRKKISDEE